MADIRTRLVEYRDGDDAFEGYFACADEGGAQRPGVLVAHTVRGRGEFEEDKARQLAELGYAALAIDVYGMQELGSDLDHCRELMDGLKSDRPLLQRRLSRALETLSSQAEVDAGRLAAIGFCFGGLCAMDLARIGAPLAGVVSFHGLFDPPGNTAGNTVDTKVLALHGWDDPLAPPDQALALAEEMTALGADWQMHAYGNVRHAFTNPAADASSGVTVYNAAADRRSWQAMRNFLSELFPARQVTE